MVSHKIRLTYDFALRGVELLIVKEKWTFILWRFVNQSVGCGEENT